MWHACHNHQLINFSIITPQALIKMLAAVSYRMHVFISASMNCEEDRSFFFLIQYNLS